ncbi:MAG: hypothetical protein HQ568_04145 [Calditrichaeota bacterium]|nr:hypothetical protein [Calditrichota bacterium]
MKRYKELYITLNGYDANEFFNLLENNLKSGWKKADTKEDFNRIMGFTARGFECLENKSLPSAILWLYTENENNDKIFIPNIVPLTKSQLSISEYNRIVTAFSNDIVTPVKDGLGVVVDLTLDYYELEDIISEESADALRKFSSCANRSTGIAHPNDQERWFAFVDLMHSNDEKIDHSELTAFLIEEGWHKEQAAELADNYTSAYDLLIYHCEQN